MARRRSVIEWFHFALNAHHGRAFQNGLTFAELEQIEEAAHHSDSDEAKVILRIAAALREAMQIEENALALMSMARPVSEDKAADSVRQKELADAKEIR